MLQLSSMVLGYSVVGSLAGAILSGCRADGGKTFKPKYLNRAQAALVSTFAERILPATNTPGAIEAGVPQFIDEFYGLHTEAEEQKKLTDALATFDSDCQNKHGKPFAKLQPDTQDAMIAELAKAQADLDFSLFRKMKEITISGYVTSEIGSNALLTNVPVPGRYQGCISLAEAGGKAFGPY
jgi:hypothetical protein